MIPEPDATRWSLICLAHLEQEEALLNATLETLRRTRAALASGDLAVLADAVSNHDEIGRIAVDLRNSRAELRRRLAAVLGVSPPLATVRRFAEQLPVESARRLDGVREWLRRMALEVGELNQSNAMLVVHCHDFVQRQLLALTGGEGGAAYGRGGRRESSACGHLIQARG